MTSLLRLVTSWCILAGISLASDWPEFHGPRRDNHSPATGLARTWPEGGPTLLWQAQGLGEGYASVAIADGRIYTSGNIGADTIVSAWDLAGRRLWQAKNGPAYSRAYEGARSTPSFSEGRLYHLNGDGDIIGLDVRTGEALWRLNMLQKFGGEEITWGLAESLLVDGERLICSPGGQTLMAALDKRSGETIWTTPGIGEKASYCSPILVEHGGLRQFVTMTSNSAVGIAADTGRLLWRYEHPARYEVNVSTPVHQEGRLALFGTWGQGATQLRLDVQGDRCTVEKLWHTTELDNEHGGVVLVNGYLYGYADGNHKKRHWSCLDWEKGTMAWTADDLRGRSATLTYADGMLILLSEQGTVALAPADPRGLRIVSRFDLPKQGDGPTWAHPVVLAGVLYVRHSDWLYAYDVREPN